jgi:hypothetical protein
MQNQPTRSLLLAAATMLCVASVQAQTTDTHKAPPLRKATAADSTAPTQAAKPGANAKVVKPSSEKLQITPAAQSAPAPHKDEAGCHHSRASDA